MEKPLEHPISFDQFKQLVAKKLQIDESKVNPESSFIDDLSVDSIQLVDLMLQLEEQGINIPFEAAWDVQTVEDAYQVYREQMA